MQSGQILNQVLSADVLVPVIFGAVGMVAIIFGTLPPIVKSVARERTRREIAAYIAEGSMTPEQGEKLMASNPQNA